MKKFYKNMNAIIVMISLMIILLLSGVLKRKCVNMLFKKMMLLLWMLLIVFVVTHSAFFVEKNPTGQLIVKCFKCGKLKIMQKIIIHNGSKLIQKNALILNVNYLLRRIKVAITWIVKNVVIIFVGNVWKNGTGMITFTIVSLKELWSM